MALECLQKDTDEQSLTSTSVSKNSGNRDGTMNRTLSSNVNIRNARKYKKIYFTFKWTWLDS